MSVKSKNRLMAGMILLALIALVSFDVANGIAQRTSQLSAGLSLPTSTEARAPLENSAVGICRSTDMQLGTLQAPIDAALSYAQVDSITRLAIQRAGGLEDLIDPGDWVCIKVNIVTRGQANARTDPRMVKSIIQQLIEEGDADTISIVEGGYEWLRNPGNDGFSDQFAEFDNLSFDNIVTELDPLTPQKIDIIDLNTSPYTSNVPVPAPGGGLSQASYSMPNAILNCDKVISAAVMKTHYLAKMTLSMKNYVGTSPGQVYTSGGTMNHWGVPHDKLDRTVVDLMSYHPPDLAITECFVGMQGEGPTTGPLVRKNLVIAGTDPVAVDAVTAYSMGYTPRDIGYLYWGNLKGYGTYDLDHIALNGANLSDIRTNFSKARRGDVRGGGWEYAGYVGRGNWRWLLNGTHGGTNLDNDYLGGESSVSPVEGDVSGGKTWSFFAGVEDYMDLSAYYGGPSSCITYAFTRVMADSAVSVRLRFGADDGIKIWLNGSVVYNNASTGSWSLVQQDIPITLNQGENRLLVKVMNTAGAYGFSMFVCESDGDTPIATEYRLLSPGAPNITLEAPVNHGSGSDSLMNLSVTVTDPESDPMTVRIYGDTDDASELLYVQQDVVSGSIVNYTWKARTLGVDANTIGLWHFDEGSGTTLYDASGHNLNGSWWCAQTADSMWTNGGVFGCAPHFFGFRNPGNPCSADFVEIPEEAPSSILDMPTNGKLTMEFWIKPDSLPTDRYWGIFVKRIPCTGADSMTCGNPANYEIFFNYSSQTLGYFANTTMFTSTVGLTVGQWQYIAVTMDGTTGELKFHKDGIPRDTIAGAFIGTPVDGPLRLGSSAYRRKAITGYMDEVRLSNRILSEGEIANNYQLSNGTYYWKVTATDGTESATSETRDFTIDKGDAASPVVTLNAPANGSSTSFTYTQLDATISDASPVTVLVYGSTNSGATNLLYVAENFDADPPDNITHNWSAPVLLAESPYTGGLWHFDEGTGTTTSDSSGNGNTGTIVGAPVWRTDGRFGYALEFDGTDDRVSVPDAASLDIDSASGLLTLEAWIHPDTSGGGTWRTVLSKRMTSGGATNYEMTLDQTTGNLLFYSGHWPQVFISSVHPPLHQWSYVAITVDGPGRDAYFYLNGVCADSIKDTVYLGGANTAALSLSGNGVTGQILDGMIDEVRITKRILTPLEIKNNYRLKNGMYYWKVSAFDGDNTTTSSIWSFTVDTSGAGNQSPVVTLNSPADGSSTTNEYMDLNATVSDLDPLKVYLYGGTTSGATQLLSVMENVDADPAYTFNYTWNAQAGTSESPYTGGLWHFDEGTGTIVDDSSGNGNTGTFAGAPIWRTGGRFGYALECDGTDDRVSVADAGSLDIDSAAGVLTMEAWLYPHTSGGGTWRTVMSKRTATGATNYEMTLNQTNGNLLFYSGHWPQVFISNIHVPLNQWSYVAITVSGLGRDAYFYLNGVKADSIMDTVYLGGANAGALSISGNGNATQPQIFDGLLDEIRITRRILTADEIAANYGLGVGTYYWRVIADDGTYQTTSSTRHFDVGTPGQDIDPPSITLNYPANGASVSTNHMELSTTVQDASPPIKVWVYGGSTSATTDVLCVRTGVANNGTVAYDWTAPVLKVDANTMGLWRFNAGTGTSVTDSSGNVNHGTFVGAPAWTTSGKFGYGLELDGTDDYVTVPDNSSLDVDSITGRLTIDVWVYPHTVGGGIARSIVAKRGFGTGAGPCNYEAYLDFTAGALGFYAGRWPQTYLSSVLIPANQWSYIAISLDAAEGKVRFYRNGICLDSISGAAFGPANATSLYVGVANTVAECFDGIIDDLRLSNRVVPSTEIAENYGLKNGTYYWKVVADDSYDNRGTSSTRSFVISADLSSPVITLNAPADGAVTTDHHMMLDATVSDQSAVAVKFYGGNTSAADQLLQVWPGAAAGSFTYDWLNAPLTVEPSYTMGLWHFDENTGTVLLDATANTNDGTITGNPVWTSDARFGYCLNFDASGDWVVIPDDPSLDIDSATGELTMEAWVYPDSVANNIWRTIISKKSGGAVNYQMTLDRTTGNLLFYSGKYPVIWISSVSVPAKQWSYVAITVKAGTGEAIFYRNGVPGDTMTGVYFGRANTYPLYLGVSAELTTEIFDGRIDEVRLSRRVLSPTEIAANYMLDYGRYYWKVWANDGTNPPTTSIVRYFDVQEQIAPAVPVLIYPSHLAAITDNTPTFRWSSTAGSGGTYTLQYATNAAFTTNLTSQSGITDTFFTPSTALADGVWYWHVQAVNGGGNSGYQATPFSFTLDAQAPPAPTGFVVVPGHEKCKLSWTNPGGGDFAGVMIRRNPWALGAYPEYDDSYPSPLGYPAGPTDGELVYQGTGTAFVDSNSTVLMPRNVYYYSIFAYDAVGNYSVAGSEQQGRATNYWLGDVNEDGKVWYEDLMILSNTFRASQGEGNYVAGFDIGPTVTGSPRGIPTTDNLVDFEDLAIFAINFDVVTPNLKVVPLLGGNEVSGNLAMVLELPGAEVGIGDEFAVRVMIQNNPGTVKAVHFAVGHDPTQLEFISQDRSQALKEASEAVFCDSRHVGQTVDMCLALLGEGSTLGGSGELTTLRFRLLRPGSELKLDVVDVRDIENRRLVVENTSAPVAIASGIPRSYGLSQNFPNPFNPETEIAYQLPKEGMVSIAIYNIHGQLVRTLVNSHQAAGSHTVRWDGHNGDGYEVSSGVYLYRMISGDYRATRKMLLMK